MYGKKSRESFWTLSRLCFEALINSPPFFHMYCNATVPGTSSDYVVQYHTNYSLHREMHVLLQLMQSYQGFVLLTPAFSIISFASSGGFPL